MTALAMSKPWAPLTVAEIASVPAQLGVFQIADDDQIILLIGYAGGREPFGLRSALTAVADGDHPAVIEPSLFRVELTHAYLTRWEELLMVHDALHHGLPAGNADHRHQLGRLTIDAPHQAR